MPPPHFTYSAPAAASTPTLVLVHGAGGGLLDWPAELPQHPGVTALDLPGHGHSRPPGCVNIDDYADAVMRAIEAVRPTRYVVVGHSMGGAVAQTLALRAAPGLSGLVLIGTGARMRVAPAILAHARDRLDVVAEAIATYGWGPQSRANDIAAWRARFLQTDPLVVYHDFLACDQFDSMERLGQIQTPALVMVGRYDQMTPLKYGRYLAEHLPRAELVTFETDGHMLPMENPDHLWQAIFEWLARSERS